MKLFVKNIIPVVILGLSLTACGSADVEAKTPLTVTKTPRDNIAAFTKLGKISDLDEKVVFGTNSKVNSHLWRVALDTLSVNSLSKIDVQNGFIQTEWVVLSPKQQVRISSAIMSPDLKHSSLCVNTYKRVERNAEWVNLPMDTETVNAIFDATLQIATELRLA